jgi:hypothetical protein
LLTPQQSLYHLFITEVIVHNRGWLPAGQFQPE